MIIMQKLPEHGPLLECKQCVKCYAGVKPKPAHPITNDWQMTFNPCSWGSVKPKFLILGFSKGRTQDKAFTDTLSAFNPGSGKNTEFDGIAFKKMRKRLTTALTDVSIPLESTTQNNDNYEGDGDLISQHINKNNGDFHFASLIRCSVARDDGKGHYKTSGALIAKSFKEIKPIIKNCFEEYLTKLPESLQVIILLGSSEVYIKNCKNLVKEHFGKENVKIINNVSYTAGGHTWVHITHPSPANGYFNKWRKSEKAYNAKQAIESALNTQ